MKKVLSAILSCAMCFGISASAMAASAVPAEKINALSVCSPESAPSIYSPEFPDAYILPNETMEMSVPDSTTQTVSATVFVEEEYGFDGSGNPITISSRLLSESEVLEIGLENFGDIEENRQEAVSEIMRTGEATNSRGRLTITFSGTYSISGNSVTCDLTGNASWNNKFSLSAENSPATGSDYMGVAWSGGFTAPSSSISADSSEIIFPDPPVLNLCDAVPNAARVWEFTELWGGTQMGQSFTIYLKNIDVNVKLYKANMVNDGNTAEAVLKYIHTYASTKGSISISANSSGVGAGFVLNSVSKQWSIVCTVYGIPQ